MKATSFSGVGLVLRRNRKTAVSNLVTLVFTELDFNEPRDLRLLTFSVAISNILTQKI
jgi:hypothetical protein